MLDVLNEIRAKLKANEPVVCVSTQLIEAGVDIDFGAVIRAWQGWIRLRNPLGDAIVMGCARSWGVCGWSIRKKRISIDWKTSKSDARQTQRVLDDFRDNPEPFEDDRIGLNAIAAYYHYYYQSRERRDAIIQCDMPIQSVGRNDDLFTLLSLNTTSSTDVSTRLFIKPQPTEILLRQSFRSADKEFTVIDSLTRGVIVP